MEDVANEANNKLKPLKYPGLGLFMTFKIIFEIILFNVRGVEYFSSLKIFQS